MNVLHGPVCVCSHAPFTCARPQLHSISAPNCQLKSRQHQIRSVTTHSPIMAFVMPPVRAKPKARQQFIKYGKCSHAELRRFLKDRTGVDFDRKTNRVKLTSRLRELD